MPFIQETTFGFTFCIWRHVRVDGSGSRLRCSSRKRSLLLSVVEGVTRLKARPRNRLRVLLSASLLELRSVCTLVATSGGVTFWVGPALLMLV